MTRLRVRSAPKYVPGSLPPAPGAALLADYISRLSTAGGALTGTRLSTLSTLFDTLVSSGVSSRIHYAVLPGAPDSFTGAVVPIIDTFGIGNCTTNFEAPEWNGEGLKGSAKNLTSSYVPSVRGTLDDTHLSIYFNENKSAGNITVLGCQDGGGAFQMYSNTFLVSNIHSDGGDRTVEFVSPLKGLSMGSRVSNTLHQLRTPSGGGADKLANQSTNARSGSLPAVPFLMIHPTVVNRILFASVGLGVTGSQYTALANALDAYTAARGTLSGDEPEVVTYVANVVSAGGAVSSTNRELLNRLIADGKRNGWLATIRRWYFPSGSDSFAGAMVPLIDTLSLGNFTNDGFTSSEWTTAGLKGTGSQYIGSKFVPSTHIADYNSFNASIEITDYVTDFSYPFLVGCKDADKSLTFYSIPSPEATFEMYEGTTNTYTTAALGVGTIVGNRSAVNSHALFFNGSTLSTNTATRTGLPPAIELAFHARNVDNSYVANNTSSRLLSIALGASQTSGQMTAMRNAIAAYKTAKGI
jgi:hypothetical protein